MTNKNKTTGWQPIETAPRDKEVLITDGHEVCTAIYKVSNCVQDKPFFATTANGELFNIGFNWRTEVQYIYATHWQPLPEPPTESRGGSDE